MIRRDDLRLLRVIVSRFVRPHLGLIALASFLGLLAAALTTVQPLVLAPIIDIATDRTADPATSWSNITLNNVGSTLLAWIGLEAGFRRVVLSAAVAYVALVALTSLIAFISRRLVSHVRAHLFRELQEAGYRHLLGLAMSYFVRQRTGELGRG